MDELFWAVMILWDIGNTSHTQFFGDFGILVRVHHPKTNVFVLQDLRCELGVHTNKSVSVKGRKASNSQPMKKKKVSQACEHFVVLSGHFKVKILVDVSSLTGSK